VELKEMSFMGPWEPPEAIVVEVVIPATKAGRKALERLREALEGVQDSTEQE
jgi:hypothetical protein